MDDVAAPDRIEKEIYIAAPAEEVYHLVARPGWWINDSEVDPLPVLRRNGDVATLEHPEWGSFHLRLVGNQPTSYASYRWLSLPHEGEIDEEIEAARSTLVEFFVEAKPGGTTLRVVETGFAELSDDESVWREQLDNNAVGWDNELKAARAFVTSARG